MDLKPFLKHACHLGSISVRGKNLVSDCSVRLSWAKVGRFLTVHIDDLSSGTSQKGEKRSDPLFHHTLANYQIRMCKFGGQFVCILSNGFPQMGLCEKSSYV